MKMRIQLSLACFALIGIWFLIGCATVPVAMASVEADLAAKEFNIPANGKAGVYIYRDKVFRIFFGSAIKMNLFADEQLIGQTARKTYHYVELTPGKHTFRGKAENSSVLPVELVANKLYYIWQEVKMGILYPRNELQLVTEEKGQNGVNESKRALSNLIEEED
jgi:hypothetical protein